MSRSAFFEGIKRKSIRFGGRDFRSPAFFHDMNLMGGVFTADYRGVQKLLPQWCRPILIFPGKTLIAIHAIEYLKSDIGSYNEISISVILQPDGAFLPHIIRNLLSLMTQSCHAFVYQLPVTSKMSEACGVHFFGFPKFVADISFRETSTHRICTLLDCNSMELILELDMMKFKTSTRPDMDRSDVSTVYVYADGSEAGNCRGKLQIHVNEGARSYLIPHLALRLGKHDISKRLSELGLGQVICSDYAPHCESILYLPGEGW